MKSNKLASKSGNQLKKLFFELTEEQKQEIKEAFDVLDTDKTNLIYLRDLNIILRALGFEVKKDEISNILNDLQKTEDDQIKYDDFYEIMKKKFVNFLF